MIVMKDEIRKAQKAGEKLSTFGVRMAVEHDIYVNQVTWYQVKNGTKAERLTIENDILKSEIAKLRKSA